MKCDGFAACGANAESGSISEAARCLHLSTRLRPVRPACACPPACRSKSRADGWAVRTQAVGRIPSPLSHDPHAVADRRRCAWGGRGIRVSRRIPRAGGPPVRLRALAEGLRAAFEATTPPGTTPRGPERPRRQWRDGAMVPSAAPARPVLRARFQRSARIAAPGGPGTRTRRSLRPSRTSPCRTAWPAGYRCRRCAGD